MTHPKSQPDNASELLPCPFCGGKAVDRRKIDGFPMIYCNGDDCFGPQTTAKSFDDALVQWNTRAPHPNCGVQTARETALARAAQDFIDKVDRGEARSAKSYAAFKAALALSSADGGGK